MQGKKKQSAAKPAPVYKPFLTGTWRGKQCFTRGLRVFAYLLGFIFVYLFVGQVLMFDSVLLRVLMNAVLLLGFAALLYSDGAKAGVDDVAFGEIALQRQQSGHEDVEAQQRSYHPAKGFCTALAGAAPLLVVSLVFAFITQLQVYQLGGLPSWLSGLERRADIGIALSYYRQPAAFGLEQVLRIVVRLAIFPFISMAGTGSAHTLLWLERFSPLLVLIVPMGYALGYMQGKRLRAMVHGAIKTNDKRRTRRERRTRNLRTEEKNTLV